MKTKKGYRTFKQQKKDAVDGSINEDGMTYEEIGKILGLTIVQVRRLEYVALQKLKRPTTENRKFYDYLKFGK